MHLCRRITVEEGCVVFVLDGTEEMFRVAYIFLQLNDRLRRGEVYSNRMRKDREREREKSDGVYFE